MKAKNPTTDATAEEEEVDGDILKGFALRTSTQHRWSTLDSKTAPKYLNAENKKCLTLDATHRKQFNSNFLSRFIEFRDSQNTKTAMAVQNQVEIQIVENDITTVNGQVSASEESQVQQAVSTKTEACDGNKAKDKGEDLLSLKDEDKKSKSIAQERKKISPEDNRKSVSSSITRDIHDIKKLSAVHRVEELKRRLEGENESKNLKNCDVTSKCVENSPKQKTEETKKSSGGTRESPPRRVSFKVRGGSTSSCAGLRAASSSSAATHRRAATAPRVTNKVAALASKFNAIILENKEEKSVEIIHGETKKKLLVIPQAPSKKTPEPKLVVTKRTAVKREGVASCNGKAAASSAKSVSLEEVSRGMGSIKENKKKTVLSHRSSSVATRSGNVKAAIQIFEQNATIIRTKKPSPLQPSPCKDEKDDDSATESTKQPSQKNHSPNQETSKPSSPSGLIKSSPVLTEETSSTDIATSSQQNLQSVKPKPPSPPPSSCKPSRSGLVSREGEVNESKHLLACDEDKKKEPKYSRVMFKRSATTLVNIALESEKVCSSSVVGAEPASDSKLVPEACAKPPTQTKSLSKSQFYVRFSDIQEKLSTDDGAQEESKNSTVEQETPMPRPITIKPNRSFLWGASTPASPLRSPEDPSPTSILATIAREATAVQEPELNDTDNLYDDVQPPSSYHNYSTLAGEQEDIYDDVGPPISNKDLPSGTAHAFDTVKDSEGDDTDNDYEYCRGAEGELCYDDCEGEGYQCIGEDRSEDTESNIYDDVKSLSSTLRTEVADGLGAADDTTSISNCYESIYSGEAPPPQPPPLLDSGGDVGIMRPGESSSASSSIGSGNQSYCDQSNSLYGVGGSRFDSASVSQASTVSAEDGPHELLTYQLTSLGQPRSETSDEWIDLEMSGCEDEDQDQDHIRGSGAKHIYQSRPRSRRSPKWSRKVRKQWSKSPRKATENVNGVFVSSPSVLYLGTSDPIEAKDDSKNNPPNHSAARGLVSLRLTLHVGDHLESQEMTFFVEKEGENSSDSENDHHYEMLSDVLGKNQTELEPYDDFDSFDSDESDETYIKPLHQDGFDIANGRLPEPPSAQNIYGISKIAEAAGKKMLKLGQSLRKIRNKRNSSGASLTNVHTENKECPPLPTTPRPSETIPPPLLPIRPEPPPRIAGKSVSSNNLSGRKYWSLRKFKRSVSTSDHSGLASPHSSAKKETATFYLTQVVDADTGSVEKGNSLNRQTIDVAQLCADNSDMAYSPQNNRLVSGDTNRETSPLSKNGGTSSSGQKTSGNAGKKSEKRYSSVRPNSPPPLPPSATNSSSADNPKRPARKEKRNTSWYAECGLFDQVSDANITATESPKRNIIKQERPSSNAWYAEVGLWDMSASSANDSSLSEQDARSQHTDMSGGETPSTAGSPENSGVIERRFADEPLYQFYNASVVERDIRGEFSDGYEEIGDIGRKSLPSRPSAMELIRPREGRHRTLWCEIPEVINSSVLSTISPHQKKLQEAKFEIITSEASYVNSLNVLEKHFISSPELCDESILSKNDRRILFANVIPVKGSSEKFLAELEACWQDNILLHGICEVIYKHASNHFAVYIKYCSNQIYLDRTLRALKDHHGKFAEVLSQLETSPVCQSLSLHSFLMLPMQRITRLPLLIDAVLTRLDPQDEEYNTCRLALATLNKVVQDCNEGARRMERMEEILILSRQLDFPREVRAIPIISSSRWLVKAGELTQLVWRGDEGKLTFGKKFSKITLYIFLFTDLLFVTKKKSEECYMVVDYCPRNLVQMTSTEGMSHLPIKFTADGGRNLLLLTMLQNHEKKTIEMILSCPLESDRQRWLEAVSPPVSDNPNETVYEEWDCPQVTAIHAYVAQQPDELSLDVADVVNVLRKVSDGWYQGERIRDGERGWFPANYTIEIASAHVRARNLKQRYRLLALSGNFLESQRKEKQSK